VSRGVHPESDRETRFVTDDRRTSEGRADESWLDGETPPSADDPHSGGREDVRVGRQNVTASPITGRKGRSASGVRESARQGWKA